MRTKLLLFFTLHQKDSDVGQEELSGHRLLGLQMIQHGESDAAAKQPDQLSGPGTNLQELWARWELAVGQEPSMAFSWGGGAASRNTRVKWVPWFLVWNGWCPDAFPPAQGDRCLPRSGSCTPNLMSQTGLSINSPLSPSWQTFHNLAKAAKLKTACFNFTALSLSLSLAGIVSKAPLSYFLWHCCISDGC